MSESDTPRTEYNKYESWKYYSDPYCVDASFAEKLERELTAVTEQRDRLAEALKISNGNLILLQKSDPVGTAHFLPDTIGRNNEALQSLTTNEQ